LENLDFTEDFELFDLIEFEGGDDETGGEDTDGNGKISTAKP